MSEKLESPFNLKNKTILITGASSGIGRSTAIVCSQKGARLFITGRNKDKLQDTLNHDDRNRFYSRNFYTKNA